MAKSSDRRRKSKSQTLPAELQGPFQQAVELHKQGHHQQAAAVYDQILQVCPKNADTLHLRGLAHQANGQSKEAVQSIRGAIKLQPDAAPYYYNLGVSLQSLDDLPGAADAYRKAIRLDPKSTAAYENLGVALADSGQVDPAISALEAALEINPMSSTALKNLGSLFYRKGDTERSLEYYNRAIEISPQDASLRDAKGEALWRKGDFAQAWPEYEWRFKSESYLDTNNVRRFSMPRWDGVHKDVRLLVTREQGVGDEILFASVLPDVVNSVAHCTLECDRRLVPLMKRSISGLADVVGPGQFDESQFDAYLEIGSLPQFYRQELSEFPSPRRGFLKPDLTFACHWREWLDSLGDSFKVGVSWRGGVEKRVSAARSIPAKYWRPLSKEPHVSFINLQYSSTLAEISEYSRALGSNLITPPDINLRDDIDSLAALVSELDLIISVSNTTIHLAGALGAPSWVMIALGPNSRYLDNSGRSVWYQSIRTFRNAKFSEDGWADVMQSVAAKLQTDIQK